MKALLLGSLFALAAVTARADEWWAWTMFDVWREPPWSAGVLTVNRFDFEDGAIVQMVSPRIRYELCSWLDTSIALSTLSIDGDHGRYWQFRPELEIDPHFDLTDHFRLEWRNRMEWRDNEGSEDLTKNRLRHRVQLAWTFPRQVGPWTRVFVSNEWLIDLHKSDWTENRLVPAGITFKTSAHSDLDIFYMLLDHRQRDGWETEQVTGTYLRVRF